MLYESRRDDHLLLVNPLNGHWWVGPQDEEDEGRQEIQTLSAVADTQAPPDYPMMIVAIKNRDCNIDCTYCFAEADKEHSYLTKDELILVLRKVLDSFPHKMINFLFTGGEPFLHFPVISEAIRVFHGSLDEAERSRCRFSFMSNGTAFKKSMLPFLKDYEINLGISLDGPADIHDRNRPYRGGQGSFKNVMTGISLLQNAGIAYSTVTTITAPEDVNKCFDFMLEKEIYRMFFRPLRMQGQELNQLKNRHYDIVDRNNYEQDMAEAMLAIADRIVAINRVGNIKLVEMTLALHTLHLLRRDNPYMCLRSPCGAATMSKLGVDWEGNFFPCDTMVEFRDLKMFGLDELVQGQDIESLIRTSGSHQKLCQRTTANISECQNCLARQFCGGGCSASSYDFFGDLQSPGDRCHYERALFEGLLWRTAETPEFPEQLIQHMA